MATDPVTIIDPPAGDPPVDPPAVIDPPVPPANDPSPPADPAPADPAKPPVDDWRVNMAGGDEKLLAFLARQASPKAAAEAFKTLSDQVKGGKLVKPLGEKPTPEEVKAFRDTFGVPEAPAGYLDKLPEGLVIGEDDKAGFTALAEELHAINAPKGVMEVVAKAYHGLVADGQAERADADRVAHEAGVEALRQEWGPEYKHNVNVARGYLDGAPAAVKDMFTNGRMPDGTLIGSNPDALRWLVGTALEINPNSTVVPGHGAAQASAIADEIKSIEDLMRTNRSEYNRDTAKQERLRQLYDARSKMKT